jgi:formylglycine-generating enzyme required for sulfatase activity
MKATIKQILQVLNGHFGASIFLDPRQFKSALADVPIEIDAKKVRNLLNTAIEDIKAYPRLELALADNNPFVIDNLVVEMLDHWPEKATAQVVIECIAELLGYTLPPSPPSSLGQSHEQLQATVIPPPIKSQTSQAMFGSDFRDTKVGIDMIFVHGGTFMMGGTSEQGDDCFDDEKPAHKVTLSDFYIGKYPVTQKQWVAVMGSNPSHFTSDLSLPVEQVRWNDAQEFIKKLNSMTGKQYRLPTEAEWEYAARGGAGSRGFKYAGSNNINKVAWYDGNSGKRTHPVGSKRPNELGIYDMSGNVWEWVNDWCGNYTAGAVTNPIGPASGSGRVFRGGGWGNVARGCRVSYRNSDTPGHRRNDFGFRLVLVP